MQPRQNFTLEQQADESGQNQRHESHCERRCDRLEGDGHSTHLQGGAHQRLYC
ncbi:MAG: hypothetical protein BWZ07_03073 [Alphaproteobacteria bacterium ADurb.BinA280]|nr:MAG: hypothetical protein BWZ07_03073 [Alphaproteobacteria bacterium ADurb.BinA280]